MAKKETIYQGLLELPVQIEDVSINSPDYFRITKLPSEFTSGINIFKFRGRPELFSEEAVIYLEILDSNGEPVYYEAKPDLESQDQSVVISVFINEDTAPGNGYIVLCSTANQSAEGELLDVSAVNVRWSSEIFIDPSKRNDAEIIFATLPEVTISGGTNTYTNFGYASGQKVASASYYNLNYYYANNTPVLVTSSLSPGGFTGSWLGADVYITAPNITNTNPATPSGIDSNTIYYSAVTNIDGSGILTLQEPIQILPVNSISYFTPSSADITSALIVFQESASLSPASTENSYNVATVFFNGLQPQVGTVTKIRSYYRSTGIGEYILSNETDISGQADEFGFTPNVVTASFALPTVHRNDRIDFKFEFVNPAGFVSKQIVESLNNLFLGGNTYIGGDDNLLTGSLFVAGATGTGVQISGKADSAMVKSIGYQGFRKATSTPTTGSAGFVLYSGSIQPILNSAESYQGVGLELVADKDNYFIYHTDPSELTVRTSRFFLGNNTAYISGSSTGALALYSTNFKVTTTGQVSASSLLVKKKIGTGTDDQTMIDTDAGILDATNIGRTLYSSTSQFKCTVPGTVDTSTISYSGGTQNNVQGAPGTGSGDNGPFTITTYNPWDGTAGKSYSGIYTSSYIEFVFQGLPNEFRYRVSYQQKLDVLSTPSGTPSIGLRFRLYSGSAYDNWTLVGTKNGTNLLGSGAIESISASYNYDVTTATIDLEEGKERSGILLKGVIDFRVRNGSDADCEGYWKNITVTGGRGFTDGGYQTIGNADWGVSGSGVIPGPGL